MQDPLGSVTALIAIMRNGGSNVSEDDAEKVDAAMRGTTRMTPIALSESGRPARYAEKGTGVYGMTRVMMEQLFSESQRFISMADPDDPISCKRSHKLARREVGSSSWFAVSCGYRKTGGAPECGLITLVILGDNGERGDVDISLAEARFLSGRHLPLVDVLRFLLRDTACTAERWALEFPKPRGVLAAAARAARRPLP